MLTPLSLFSASERARAYIKTSSGEELHFVLGRCFPLSYYTLVDSPRVFFFPFSLETLNGSSCSSPVKLITMEQERKDKSPPQPTGCMYCEMKFTKITQRKTFFVEPNFRTIFAFCQDDDAKLICHFCVANFLLRFSIF